MRYSAETAIAVLAIPVLGAVSLTVPAINSGIASASKINCSNFVAGANLKGCDLAGVSFAGTTLTGVNFSKADLAGADFGGATLGNDNFARGELHWCADFHRCARRYGLRHVQLFPRQYDQCG